MTDNGYLALSDARAQLETLAYAAPIVPAPRRKLNRLDVAKMSATHAPQVPWLVQGLVCRGALSLLIGQAGQGKSLLALALAAGVARGRQVAGIPCTHGRVLILDAENGAAEIHRRIRCLGLPGDGIDIYDADGFDLENDLGLLEELLDDQRPDVLIIDSFRSLWMTGEENDSGSVTRVMQPLKKLVEQRNVGALMLHHAPKEAQTYRGSGAIAAVPQIVTFMQRHSKDREDSARRLLDCLKCRVGPEPWRRWIRITNDEGAVRIDKAPKFAAPVNVSRTPA